MSKQPTIAIADDNPVAGQVLAALLEDQYEVRLFESGTALLAALARHPLDLLLLDVAMPGLSGYETCRLLRDGPHQPDLPVIFVSGRALLDDRLQGYAAGGNDYLSKSYHFDELEAKMGLAIDSHRRARRLAVEVGQLRQVTQVMTEQLGTAGVVLAFHHALGACQTPDELAQALVVALNGLGLDGCMRLQCAGHPPVTRSAGGSASALEASLLDDLAAQRAPRAVTLQGQHLGFSFGSATLLVRCPAWALAADAPQTADAMARARDDLTGMLESAVVRLQALDLAHEVRLGASAQRLIAATRTALLDSEAPERAAQRELEGVLEALRKGLAQRSAQLGLSAEQQAGLAETLAQHQASALALLERSRAAAAQRHRLVEQLLPAPQDAAAGDA